MAPIPLYLKTDAVMPRPQDSEFYLLTRDGPFFCRNHPFFTTDVPTRRPIKALAAHEPHCELRYPKVSSALLERIVGFFGRVYEQHGSEAVVLLLWDLVAQHYRVHVPDQEATVWESRGGSRSAWDVTYRVPTDLPARHLLVGDLHSHAAMPAYASMTDRADEARRDGVHGVVGRLDRDPPDFHLALAIDGYRFTLARDQLFEGYARRRRFPRRWLDQVRVKVERSSWASYWYVGG